ncbi:MAG: hypothetical protein GF368_00740 [Candidatus Aenigmarchaeota archaeon]|nr:hypothetical protein [Candidatus Aenigmarchaeota archaeon]
MNIVEIDERGRILIPKEIRKGGSIKPRQQFIIKIVNDNDLFLDKIENPEKATTKNDPFIQSIKNPAHVSPNKLKKINLEKLEDEMWSE